MALFRRPVLWAVMIAAVFSLTIGGSPLPRASEDVAENLVDDVPVVVEKETVRPMDGAVARAQVPAVAVVLSESKSETKVADQVGGPTEEEVAAFEATTRMRIITHVVQPGETLSTIAARFNIAQETILASNEITNANLLRAGQRLNILSTDGAIHRVQRGESLWDIARIYRVDLNEIANANNLADPNRLQASQELIIPGSQAAAIGSGLRSERLVGPDGRLLPAFSWPVQGRISSGYGMRWGRMHHGLDVAVVTGTPIRASAAGRVSFAGWNGGYGYLVVIDHGNLIETRYAHLSRIVVNVGQQVRRGDLVAYSGNTGNSTGPHLHFEIRQRGQSVNPINFLR